LAKRLGFNGARLHQKVFEPRYFFHADQLGFLTFAEYPDWAGGQTQRWEVSKEYEDVVRAEWDTIVKQLHNHPSIIAWGPFNEYGPKDGWEYNRGAGGGFKNRYTAEVRSKKIRRHCDFVRDVVRRVRRKERLAGPACARLFRLDPRGHGPLEHPRVYAGSREIQKYPGQSTSEAHRRARRATPVGGRVCGRRLRCGWTVRTKPNFFHRWLSWKARFAERPG